MVTIVTRLEATADAEADLVLASGIIGTRKNDIVQTVIMTLLIKKNCGYISIEMAYCTKWHTEVNMCTMH